MAEAADDALASPAKAEASADATGATPTDDTPARDETGKFKGKGTGKPRTDPIARMQAATQKEADAKREAAEARQEAARLRTELDALKRPAAAPTNGQSAQPTAQPGKFAFPKFDQWLAQHPDQDWEAYQESREEARDQWRDHQHVVQTKLERHAQRLAEAPKKYADWDAVYTANGNLPTTPTMAQAILDSDRSDDLVYWLVTHPESCTQLAEESRFSDPAAAAVWMRKYLEAQVTAAAVSPSPDSAPSVRPSAAKPPINRVGGTASLTPASPDDLEFGPEYIRRENERERKSREAGRW